jgi:hypothetical protein
MPVKGCLYAPLILMTKGPFLLHVGPSAFTLHDDRRTQTNFKISELIFSIASKLEESRLTT